MGQGAFFLKAPVTFWAWNYILKSKSVDDGVAFILQTRSTCFVNLQFYCLAFKTKKNWNL